MRFAFIQERQEEYPVALMCRMLKVSRSGYYGWRDRKDSARSKRRGELIEQMCRVRQASRNTYGSPRMTVELKGRGMEVCENTVAKYMREAGICAAPRRRFVPRTTDSTHDHPIAPNRLERDFAARAPNQKWACDLTCIRTDQGWLFLAVVMDLFSRKIVGWSMSENSKAECVAQALSMAISRRKPPAGLLHHSDRGVQYACGLYRRLLLRHGIAPSMSRRGNCYDNACVESFFGTLKSELVHRTHYPTRRQAEASVFEWIEVFYNRQRRHSSLGYLSPEAFEAQIN
jgi:transposase InsO family protein